MKLTIENYTKLVNGTVVTGGVFWGIKDVHKWNSRYVIHLIEKTPHGIPKTATVTIYRVIKEDTFDRKYLNTAISTDDVGWHKFVIGLTDIKTPQRLLKWISNIQVLGC